MVPGRLATLGLVITACGTPRLAPHEGFLDVTGGRIWYRVVGDGPGVPLLTLHGGPGFPSYYLEPLAALGDERPVIFYDQLGAGRSDRPSDPSLWRVDRFVEEIALLREHLGLEEIHLLGHSWGTMLGIEYLLTSPAGVRSVIFASPALSVSRWLADADSLKRTLPDSIQQAITRYEAEQNYTAPEYQAAVLEFYRHFLSRLDPWSPLLDSTFAQAGLDVYNTMWGPSEFTATGILRTFERADALRGLNMPVLFTTGRYDEATPATVEYYRSLTPDAALVIFENSAHMTMLDDEQAYVAAVRHFLGDH